MTTPKIILSPLTGRLLTEKIDDLIFQLDDLPTLEQPDLSQDEIDLIIDALVFYKEMQVI
jgi:hypothetical protein